MLFIVGVGLCIGCHKCWIILVKVIIVACHYQLAHNCNAALVLYHGSKNLIEKCVVFDFQDLIR